MRRARAEPYMSRETLEFYYGKQLVNRVFVAANLLRPHAIENLPKL